MTGTLNMHASSYEGSITFGSTSAWRCGIRQHDDGDAELRIWAKNSSGMIVLATGYDGEPASIARPTDGLFVIGNNIGIGNFSGADPAYKLDVKGTIGTTGKVSIYGGNTTATVGIKCHDNGWDGGIRITDSNNASYVKLHQDTNTSYGFMIGYTKLYIAQGVGIGTTAGSHHLNVGGTANFSGAVTTGSSITASGELTAQSIKIHGSDAISRTTAGNMWIGYTNTNDLYFGETDNSTNIHSRGDIAFTGGHATFDSAVLSPSGGENIINRRTMDKFTYSVNSGNGFAGNAKYCADEVNRTTSSSWTSYGVQCYVGNGTSGWWKVDTGGSYRITHFAVSSYAGGSHKPGGDWALEGSNDDSSWTVLGVGKYNQIRPYGYTGSDNGGSYPFEPRQIVQCSTLGDYRYFRIQATNFGANGTNAYLLFMNVGLWVGGHMTDSFNNAIYCNSNAEINGTIKATSDITAYYSDSRLKDFHGVIEKPIDKIMKLNGYYFTENAKAKELGYSNDKMQIGVSAQEIEEVLPELIKDAPINNDRNTDYKTIDYGKLTPLLIEAIKELKNEVNQLKGINND
jgi:hypothetical protein